MSVARTALIVFARAPRLGAVKTRLAVGLGASGAVDIYAALLGHALRLAAQWPGPRYLACADVPSQIYFQQLPAAASFNVVLQQTGDLGTRMRAALADALACHASALLMGSDVVDNHLEDLRHAGAHLQGACDVVLGPVADGGYWLIGMNRDQPTLFESLPWGTAQVSAQTLQRCATRGLVVRELPLRHDIDEPADVQRHAALLAVLPRLPLA